MKYHPLRGWIFIARKRLTDNRTRSQTRRGRPVCRSRDCGQPCRAVACCRRKQNIIFTKRREINPRPTVCAMFWSEAFHCRGDLPDAPFFGRRYRTFCVILRSATKRDDESPTAQEAPWGTSLWLIAVSLHKVTLCKDQCEHSFPDALCCASGDPSTFFVVCRSFR